MNAARRHEERRVEWFCRYTFIKGENAGMHGYSVSPTTDLERLRVDVAAHNANPDRTETLEIWRREIVEAPEPLPGKPSREDDQGHTNLAELNTDLCRSLGIADPGTASSVDLRIRPGCLPQLIVARHLMKADGLWTAVELLDLAPRARAPDSQGTACA